MNYHQAKFLFERRYELAYRVVAVELDFIERAELDEKYKPEFIQKKKKQVQDLVLFLESANELQEAVTELIKHERIKAYQEGYQQAEDDNGITEATKERRKQPAQSIGLLAASVVSHLPNKPDYLNNTLKNICYEYSKT